MERLGRLGLVAKAVLYAVIGLLAIATVVLTILFFSLLSSIKPAEGGEQVPISEIGKLTQRHAGVAPRAPHGRTRARAGR